MRFALIITTVLLALPALAADVVGIPRIVDGDTVEISGTKIRLEGIDAAESDQLCLDARGARWACGIAARDALERHASGKVWTCRPKELDRYGRTVATCFAERDEKGTHNLRTLGGEDVDRWMVRQGWALAFVRYSQSYVAEEAAAREGRAGLWAGAFIAPWDWRSRNTHTVVLGAASVPVNARALLLGAASSEGAPSPSCTIKGNVSRSGECIFHMPGGRWYSKVNMTATGKRWFCIAAEAEAAGCRAAKQ